VRALVRAEAAEDRAAVFALNASAFGRPAEAELVERLRAAGAATLSLVALAGGAVVGHVLFSPVRVEGPPAWDALGLAPMAVAPARQRAGIGSQLVRAGLAACRDAGHRVVFVLGHPRFYPRFGFRPAAALGLRYAEPGCEAAFFVAELTPGALAGRGGELVRKAG
jgi:putative acetyltransferase